MQCVPRQSLGTRGRGDRALVGKKVGDKVEVEIPKGTLEYEILKIDYME